jgi:hypothetical protein
MKKKRRNKSEGREREQILKNGSCETSKKGIVTIS